MATRANDFDFVVSGVNSSFHGVITQTFPKRNLNDTTIQIPGGLSQVAGDPQPREESKAVLLTCNRAKRMSERTRPALTWKHVLRTAD